MTLPLTARDVAAALMARFGSAWSREIARACIDAYLPLHLPAPEPGVSAELNLAYGPHPRQRLNLYRPVTSGPHPAVIFFHGGGLNGGDKQLPESGGRFYSNVGRYLARHGVVALIVNYRLVPEAVFPDGGVDVGLAVAWARAHLGAYGSDSQRLTLFGNSAGAVHVATYLLTGWVPGEVRQALLLSTPFTMPDHGPRLAVTAAYYGPDSLVRASRLPLGLLQSYSGPRPPLRVLTAEHDPEEIIGPSLAFVDLFRSRFGSLTHEAVPGHNHITTVLSLNTDDDSLGRLLLDAALPT